VDTSAPAQVAAPGAQEGGEVVPDGRRPVRVVRPDGHDADRDVPVAGDGRDAGGADLRRAGDHAPQPAGLRPGDHGGVERPVPGRGVDQPHAGEVRLSDVVRAPRDVARRSEFGEVFAQVRGDHAHLGPRSEQGQRAARGLRAAARHEDEAAREVDAEQGGHAALRASSG